MSTRPGFYDPAAYCLHRTEGGHDAFYCLRIDAVREDGQTLYRVIAVWGEAAADRPRGERIEGTFTTREEALDDAHRRAEARERQGDQDVRSITYGGGLTIDQVLAKLDTTRLLGLVPPPEPGSATPGTRPVMNDDGSMRQARQIPERTVRGRGRRIHL